MDPNNPEPINPNPQYPPVPPDPEQIIASQPSVDQENPSFQSVPESTSEPVVFDQTPPLSAATLLLI